MVKHSKCHIDYDTLRKIELEEQPDYEELSVEDVEELKKEDEECQS